jgi:hypothetical protein
MTEKKNKTRTLYLTHTMDQELVAAAKRENVAVMTLIRRFITVGLEMEKNYAKKTGIL